MQHTYTIGSRTFVLDRAKAEAALGAKRPVQAAPTVAQPVLVESPAGVEACSINAMRTGEECEACQ
jgi:hypothetical protein